MSHPTREEWMAYLYGEAGPRSKRALKGHLKTCGECQENVELWRGVMGELDIWQLPRKRSYAWGLRRIVRWAAAAALLVGLGFGIGRLSMAASVDVEELRAELEPAIRQSLRQELNTERLVELRALRTELRDELYEKLTGDLNELGAEIFVASNALTNQFLTEFIGAFNATRLQERQGFAALLRRFESQRASDYVRLGVGLETLAVATGEEFLRTRQDLAELAVLTIQPVSTEREESDVSNQRRSKWNH